MSDIFQYVAQSDPDASISIINKYGYNVERVHASEDLGECLRQLVAEEGEPAMKDIYSIHPDKDQIIELYAGSGPAVKKDDCGCKEKSGVEKSVKSFMNQITNNSNTQIQLCILAAAIFLGAAILSKN